MRRLLPSTLTALLCLAAGTLAPACQTAHGAGMPHGVTYLDGRLTARLDRQNIRHVVTEILADLRAELHGVVDPARTVTVAFEALPLRDALERLLRPQSFMLRYDGHGVLRALDVLSTRGRDEPANSGHLQAATSEPIVASATLEDVPEWRSEEPDEAALPDDADEDPVVSMGEFDHREGDQSWFVPGP